MARAYEDLTGRKFGHWTVLEKAEKPPELKGRALYWKCKCVCGTVRIVGGERLRNGQSKSCGCHKNDYNRKHGGKGSRLYECWRHMRYRCENPNNQAYASYGGRGVSVCEEWHDFSKFRDWAEANGYDETLTLDRIDVNGNYEPSNCRWATSKTQMNNRRMTPHYEHNGESLTMSEWSVKTGIPRSTIYNRMKIGGMTFEEAITK